MTALSCVWSVFFCLFLFHHSKEQYVGIDVTNTQISVGTSYISVNCGLYGKIIFRDKYSKIELHLQCRQNKTNDWQTIVLLNDSGSFITNISKDIETNLEKNGTCDYDDNRYCKGFRIYAKISIHLESCKGYLDPSFRCQLFDIYGRFKGDRSKEVQLEISSKPSYTDSPSIIYPLTSKAVKLGEVLQMQCTGEEDVNIQTKDIRWCKYVSGKYEVISLQDTPQTQIVSQSKDGCTFVQKSEIFYHITDEDNELEIMCELGYNENSKICDKGRFNSTLRIATELNDDEWALSPVIVYSDDSMLNPQNLTIEGIGRTVQLLCVGSKSSQIELMKEEIMWCVRNKNNTEWTPIVLQENKLETMINSSRKITIYSKVTYHLIGLDKSIDIMCQISSSPKCASGVISSNVSLQLNPSESEDQYYLKQRERREAWLAVTLIISGTLLVVILVFVTILLILAYRRGGLSLFGILIQFERNKRVVNIQGESRLDTDVDRHVLVDQTAGVIYNNQQIHSNVTNRQSYQTTAITQINSEQPAYEEINSRERSAQEYEALSHSTKY
ncbi:uncharacterized protein [Magallana gigas]|uniref:uncharacterized protein isoform X2 n=1 Tax=Magallana gigas TaxID=29159 RepID=UPI003340C5D2